MRIDKYTYMDRQSPDHAITTKLLVNGKVEGQGAKRLKKLPGYRNVITARTIHGETIEMATPYYYQAVLRGYTSTPMFLAIYNNSLYYTYEGNDMWQEIEWRGDDSPNFPDPRFYSDRGRVVIVGGPDGTEAILRYINRESSDEEGYFSNQESFSGLWFGPTDVPVPINGQTAMNLYITEAKHAYAYYLDCGSTYYILGVYVFDDGEIGIPSQDSVLSFYVSPSVTGEALDIDSFIAHFRLDVGFNNLDKRVIAIQFYVASTAESVADLDAVRLNYELGRGIRTATLRGSTGETELERLGWKYFKRVWINKPVVLYAGSGLSDHFGTDNRIIRYTATEGSAGWFPNSSLNDKYYMRYKAPQDTEWLGSEMIVGCVGDSGDSYMMITLENGVFVLDTDYVFEIYKDWTEYATGYYRILFMLRYDGYSSDSIEVIDELGSPIDTVQPWALVDEYFPQPSFFTIQDRRAFRLDCQTDDRYRNMLMWSELNTIRTTPNQNSVMLNTQPEDEAKGLVAIDGGLFALFRRSCHYIRMTGEPIEYDREEGVIQEGCISKNSVVVVNGVCYYLAPGGFRAFDRGVKDISTAVIQDLVLDLIAHCEVRGGLDYIYGGYSQKMNMVVWSFPYSYIELVDDYLDTGDYLYANALGYDIENGGWSLIEMGQRSFGFFSGSLNELYGNSQIAIHEWFASDQDNSNRMIWQSGAMTPEMAETVLKRFRASYKGVFTVKFYLDGRTTANATFVLPDNTLYAPSIPRTLSLRANKIEFWVESSESTAEQILGPIEITGKENAIR